MRILMLVICLSGLLARAEGDLSVRMQAVRRKASDFMYSRQKGDGSWLGNPAITGLAVLGLHSGITDPEKMPPAVSKALDFIVSCAKDEGMIEMPGGRAGYPVYTTSICLLALVRCGREEDAGVIRRGRNYLLEASPNPEDSDTVEQGSSGYSYGKKGRADLNNTAWALEALAATDYLDREPFSREPGTVRQVRLAWDKALAFVTSCQNLKDTNGSAWIKSAPEEDRGGFIYCPADAMSSGDEKMLRSYGSMTYSGLKSLVYARVSKDDVRITAAMDWIRRYYTMEENPGAGQAGYFYYLHTLAKTLSVMKVKTLADSKGIEHNWIREFVEAVEKRQEEDGSFSNSRSGRWWEGMKELSTSYVLMSLDILLIPRTI